MLLATFRIFYCASNKFQVCACVCVLKWTGHRDRHYETYLLCKCDVYNNQRDAGCSQTYFDMQTLKIKSLDAMELLSIIMENSYSTWQKKDKPMH